MCGSGRGFLICIRMAHFDGGEGESRNNAKSRSLSGYASRGGGYFWGLGDRDVPL